MFQKLKVKLAALKIVAYFRELSIVMIGVMATLAITSTVSEKSKQSEIEEMFRLIRLELEKNKEIINGKNSEFATEFELMKLLRENIDNITVIPSEKLIRHNLIGGIYIYRPIKDAYSVLISSSLTSHVRDKSFLLDLMQSYSVLEDVTRALDYYTSSKIEAFEDCWKVGLTVFPFIQEMEKGNPYPLYEQVLKRETVKNFLYLGENLAGVEDEIKMAKRQLERMISEIEKKYGK